MSAISAEEIKHLATLARLTFSETEEAQLTSQLPHIIEFVDQVSKISKNEKSEETLVVDQAELRDDEISSQNLTSEELSNLSPAWRESQVEVPGVFNERTDD